MTTFCIICHRNKKIFLNFKTQKQHIHTFGINNIDKTVKIIVVDICSAVVTFKETDPPPPHRHTLRQTVKSVPFI